MRKMAIVEDEDDDEEEEVKAAPKAAAPKAAMRKMAIVEDEDDEDDAPPAPTGGLRKIAIEEDDDDDDDECAPPPAEAPLDAAAAGALQAADAIRLAGNGLFNSGRYEGAIGKYSEALDRLVGSSRAASDLAVKCLNNRAACCCQLQQYRSAIRDCSDVLERAPDDAKALMRRAFSYEAIERYADALADMRRVVSLEPSSHASAACIRLQKFAQQSADLQQAEKAAPAAAAKSGAKVAAKAAPTQAASVAPAAKPAPPSPAAAAPPASKPAAATAAAAAASTSRVSDAEAKAADAKERGTAALRRGEFRDAAAAYHEACKLQPNVHTHFSNLSLALLKLGQPEHAVTAARRCTELAPTFGKGFFRLGQALRAKGDASSGADSLKEALRLTQASGGKEAAEIARELAACRQEAAKATAPEDGGAAASAPTPAASAPKPAAGAPSGMVVDVTDVTDAPAEPATGGGGASPTSPPKGHAVSQERAAAVAKRAAELAAKSGKVGSAAAAQPVATLSAFERRFDVVWARGKGADDPAALREALGLLPSASAVELGKFVREGLTEELLSAVVLATSKAGEPAATAATRLVHLASVRRFGMAWMFVGNAEKSAVTRLLSAAAGCADVDAAELAAAAKRYGVQLA